MFKALIKLANKLDHIGEYKIANIIDWSILKYAQQLTSKQQEYYNLIANGKDLPAGDISWDDYDIARSKIDKQVENIANMIVYGLDKEDILKEFGSEFTDALYERALSLADYRDEDRVREKQTLSLKELRDKLALNDNQLAVMLSEPYKGFEQIEQPTEVFNSGPKPNGLWYACGDGWLNFVIDNDYGVSRYNYVYILELNYANIIKITNEDEMLQFFNKFRDYSGRLSMGLSTEFIDWHKVAQNYSGVEICPYINTDHYFGWYRTWDIASGCIWDSGAIKNARLVAKKIDRYNWQIV